MMRDPTEFRQRFAAWKAKKKVYDAGRPIPKYDDGKPPGSEQAPMYSELDEAVLSEIMQQFRNIAHPGNIEHTSYRTDVRGKKGGTAQRTYLLPRFEQEDIFLRDGYIKGKEGDYGLVEKAVNNRNLPVWQTKPDAVSRETLVPIGNAYGMDSYGYINRDKELVHAESHPSTFYVDGSTGKLYIKGWDLNDYGSTGGGNSSKYNIFKKAAANILDFIGSPVVVTTGFQEVTNPWGGPSEHLNRGVTIQDLFDYDDDGYPIESNLGKLLDNVMSKQGLHRENVEGKWLYALPEVTVTATKKHDSGKSIKPLPEYDGGKALKKCDDGDTPNVENWTRFVNSPLSEEIVVRPENIGGNLIEQNQDYLNWDPNIKYLVGGQNGTYRAGVPTYDNSWLKYWGNVGTGYVNKALNEAAPYVLNGMAMLMGNPIGAFAGIAGGIVGEDIGAHWGPTGRIVGSLVGGIMSDNLINFRSTFNPGLSKIKAANNASKISKWTPEQWTAAQDAAIARGDIAEAQRLRDLHFKVNAPDTKMIDANGNPIHNYHGTNTKNITVFREKAIPNPFFGKNRIGIYFTKNKKAASLFASGKNRKIYDTYLNFKNPYVQSYKQTLLNNFKNLNPFKKKHYFTSEYITTDDLNNTLKGYDAAITEGTENVALKSNQIKLADAVTYDDNGVRIPLGERDNFNINDIRYALAPLLLGGTTAGYWLKDDSGYDKGKSIHINPANRGKFNATKKRTGKTTEQLAHSKNPLTRKRAIFALNARKWKH